MDTVELKAAAAVALVGLGVSLLKGKAIKRLIFLPLEWLARKTSTKVDDVLVAEVEKDVGLEKSTLDEASSIEKDEGK